MPNYVPIQDLAISHNISDSDYVPVSDGATTFAVTADKFKAYSADRAEAAAAAAEAAATQAEAAAASLTVDPTLSVSGYAADAKVTGDKLGELKSAIFQNKTANIPCAIVPAITKADLTLSGYSGKNVFISNRNLLPQFVPLTDHDVTLTANSDGSISLSGTANGAASFRLSINNMPNLRDGKYKLIAGNGSTTIGDDITYIQASINDAWSVTVYARLDQANSSCAFELGENDVLDGMRIRISTGVTIPSGYKIYPMLVAEGQDEDFVKHEGSVLSPTSENVTGVDVYAGYTYICAQSGVTGSVAYVSSIINQIEDDIDNLDERVTTLESIAGKFVGKKIVCFGDSLVGNFPPPTDYPSMIADITGATVYNVGFGGCMMCDEEGFSRRLFSMCKLVDSIVAGDFSAQENSGVSITYAGTSTDYVPTRLATLNAIDWSEIDYITIAYGTNDWNSNDPLDNENDSDDTSTYLGAFRYSVEKLLAAYPNLKILVITPLWRWWDTNTGMPSDTTGDFLDANDYAKGTGYKLWQYGDALEEAAKPYHIPVLNLYWKCMMTKQNRLQYFNSTDGTHPKEAGRRLMAQIISAALESMY